jgi:hypothetical protein
VIEIDAAISSTAGFRQWRVEARNIVDHRRRVSRWWLDAGLWVWRCQDGQVRGIASLGSVLSDEFTTAFDRRWPTVVQPIDPAALRDEVISVIGPGMIYTGPSNSRYQGLKFFGWPRGRVRKRPLVTPAQVEHWLEPMPVLL